MKKSALLAACALACLHPGGAQAQDRTTYVAGSSPQVLINWESFEDSGFPANWKGPVTQMVINSYTRLNRIGGVDVRPQFAGYVTDGRTDSRAGEIVVSANEAHGTSRRLASTFGNFPDRLKIVFHRNAGATMEPWNFTPFYPEPGETSMQAVMMHEFGHALGLDHSPSGKGLMNGGIRWDGHFGPWAGDVGDLRALYPLRDDDRLRGHQTRSAGSSWATLSGGPSNLNATARTTHEPAVAGDRDEPFYKLAWTTPGNRLSWLTTDGQSVDDWYVFGGGPVAMFGSAMASGQEGDYLWLYVDEAGDQRRIRALRSTDDGRRWSYTGFPDARTYGRPGLAFTRAGGRPAWVASWAAYDDAGGDEAVRRTGRINVAVSFDHGRSWTDPVELSDFYRVHDGVRVSCDDDGSCLLGVVWGGGSGTWAYGQNKLRFARFDVSGTGRIGPARWCYSNHGSRVAPDMAFDVNEGRHLVGVREQNYATSYRSMNALAGQCPSGWTQISGSTTHVAPALGYARRLDAVQMWGAKE